MYDIGHYESNCNHNKIGIPSTNKQTNNVEKAIYLSYWWQHNASVFVYKCTCLTLDMSYPLKFHRTRKKLMFERWVNNSYLNRNVLYLLVTVQIQVLLAVLLFLVFYDVYFVTIHIFGFK